MKRYNWLSVTFIGVALFVAACGGSSPDADSDPEAESIATSAPEAEPTSTPAPEAEASTAQTDDGQATTEESNLITTASGLQYEILQEGSGEKPEAGNIVSVHYTGTLEDGTKFDSSVDRNQPFQFPLGQGRVIKGWDEGVALLNVGTKARFIIPTGAVP
ncbi:MAG: FKBP-type peptidyl-prolyl cis-trans isomerase [Chloroflexota bacterium]